MTEDMIERHVERQMNSLDRRFLSPGSGMTQQMYDAHVRQIDQWAQEQYRAAKREG